MAASEAPCRGRQRPGRVTSPVPYLPLSRNPFFLCSGDIVRVQSCYFLPPAYARRRSGRSSIKVQCPQCAASARAPPTATPAVTFSLQACNASFPLHPRCAYRFAPWGAWRYWGPRSRFPVTGVRPSSSTAMKYANCLGFGYFRFSVLSGRSTHGWGPSKFAPQG